MGKINIAELLRECPMGMELDCAMFEGVYFDCIDDVSDIIKCYIQDSKHKIGISFNKYGHYSNISKTKCVIFPKGKTTWEGFHRPFKDGDIVFYNDTIAIFKEWGDETLFRTYVTKYLCCDSLIDTNVPLFGKSVRKEIRLATEEERQSLFRAIKDNGYKWDEKTKTLKKLFELKFKVGDKVYNIIHNENQTITKLSWDSQENEVIYQTNNNEFVYVNYLQPYKKEIMEGKPDLLQRLKEYFENTPREVIEKEWHEYDKYNEIGPSVDEYLEYVSSIRQPKYPKTYKECCEVLGIEEDLLFVYEDIDGNHINPACISNYRIRNLDLYHNFEKLRICRDAYWKIAGKQMGLGKPWELPFNESQNDEVIYFIVNKLGEIYKDSANIIIDNRILAFPTKEMRDAFYDNFKELIEMCKELL